MSLHIINSDTFTEILGLTYKDTKIVSLPPLFRLFAISIIRVINIREIYRSCRSVTFGSVLSV